MGSDKFLVYGEDYKQIRDEISQKSLQRNLQDDTGEVVSNRVFFLYTHM